MLSDQREKDLLVVFATLNLVKSPIIVIIKFYE